MPELWQDLLPHPRRADCAIAKRTCACQGHGKELIIFPMEFFRRLAMRGAEWMGSPWTFAGALLLIAIWIGTGPLFGWNDTWQLIANTATTLFTTLTVTLIQSSQNRSDKATQLKLDELIRVTEARNRLEAIECATDAELKELDDEFQKLREGEKEPPP